MAAGALVSVFVVAFVTSKNRSPASFAFWRVVPVIHSLCSSDDLQAGITEHAVMFPIDSIKVSTFFFSFWFPST
jgi:hypothetical protein